VSDDYECSNDIGHIVRISHFWIDGGNHVEDSSLRSAQTATCST
jgi:hypothetical protein